MRWGWFLSFQPTPNSLCCVLNKRTEEKAGAWVCLFVWACFALFICLNYLRLHLKWPKFARQLQSFHLDAGTVALAQCSCWLWVCPMHSPRRSLGDRGGLWPCSSPTAHREWENRAEDGQGKGKCGWDFVCVLFVRIKTASSTYQKWRLLGVKCSNLLDNTSCLVLKQLSHSTVSSVIRDLPGLITEIYALTFRCLPEP